ncbi:MAG: hypothetical protein R3D66_04460 [Alphaproteobacteria bacterium]
MNAAIETQQRTLDVLVQVLPEGGEYLEALSILKTVQAVMRG